MPEFSEANALALIRQQWPLRHVYAHYRQSLRWNISAVRISRCGRFGCLDRICHGGVDA